MKGVTFLAAISHGSAILDFILEIGLKIGDPPQHLNHGMVLKCRPRLYRMIQTVGFAMVDDPIFQVTPLGAGTARSPKTSW